jgi:hypothetical protein
VGADRSALDRSFHLVDLGRIMSIAPAFYTVSALNGSAVVSTAAPLEAQLRTRRVAFCELLRDLPQIDDVVPVDLQAQLTAAAAAQKSPAKPAGVKAVLGDAHANSPGRRRADVDTTDDMSPLPSAALAQRRIDALLGHPQSESSAAVPGRETSVEAHMAAAEERGRALDALAARHRANQPLLRVADEAIDLLRSHFSMQKRASLPQSEVLSTLCVGLQLKLAQASEVLQHLVKAVPEWLSTAKFGSEWFVSIKPMSIMSTNAAHELFAARTPQ